MHRRTKDTRDDTLHKLISKLAIENQVVVLADFNVKGMMANHKLA